MSKNIIKDKAFQFALEALEIYKIMNAQNEYT